MASSDNKHNKYVAEIFGYPPTNTSEKPQSYRRTHICPFMSDNRPCDPDNKISNLTDDEGNRLLTHQTGACTAWHNPSWSDVPYPVIICPYRFFEDNTIFNSIKQQFFDGNNIVVTGEVGIRPFGTADGLIGEIIDQDGFERIGRVAHIEYQSDSTTGTRGIVECIRDSYHGINVTSKNYGYGLNSKASVKGSSLQMIDKGYLFEEIRVPSIWILQDYLFAFFRRTFAFPLQDVTNLPLPKDKFFYFLTVKLVYNQNQDKFNLSTDKYYVTTPEDIQKSITGKQHDITLDLLRDKIRQCINNRFTIRV